MSLMQPEQPVDAAADPYAGMAEVPCYGVLVVEGVETGDNPRRVFAPGSLTFAAFPLTFKFQEYEAEGHNGAGIAGRIDNAWRDGALIRWVGALDNVGECGSEAVRLRRGNFVRGVSIMADDTDNEDIEMIYPQPTILPEPVVEMGSDGYDEGDADSLPVEDDPEVVQDQFAPEMADELFVSMEPTHVVIHAARVRSATLLAEPAFVEATMELGESPFTPPPPQDTEPAVVVEETLADVMDEAEEIDSRMTSTTTVAAGYTITIPDIWPESWFNEPTEMPPFGALHVTDQGRVYGLLAPAGVSHRGFRASGRDVKAPTGIDYSEFMNKPAIVAGADGNVYRIPAGSVTFDCGHASPVDPRRADPSFAAAHYENSCSVAARIRVGENRYGTWVAGALLHGIDADTIERMMACALSGDWQGGKLKGALLVPVEGFPQAATASVRVREDAIVASAIPVRFVEPAPVPEPAHVRGLYDLIASAAGRDDRTRWAEIEVAAGYDASARWAQIEQTARG